MSQASEQTPLLSKHNDSQTDDTSESTNGAIANGDGNGDASASKSTVGDVEAGKADVLPTVRLATIVPALAIGVCAIQKSKSTNKKKERLLCQR